MRDLSAVYKQSVSSDARNYTIHLNVWKKTVDDNGNVSFPENTKATYTSSDSLISLSIIDGQTSGNSFQLGQTFCPIISFTTVPNLNIKTGDKVQVELVFTSFVKATLATGYIDEYSYDSIDYAVSYTAYGKMIQLDKEYNSALTYPATFSAMVNEICSQNGLTFDTFDWKCNAKLKAKPVFGNLDNGDPAYASAREMLGIIAGVNGCNVVIGTDEKVKFVPYTDTKTGITYEDAFSRQVNNEKYVIKKAVLNDGGQTSGNEAGYVELYFPLETVEGKASCLEKLNSVITGLSVMGMTVQIQGRGYYEIGDMLSYTDFDGEKYTIGVMGIKYDFSGGYFTETLYSLAPSEMEEQYKGNVRYSSSSTTLKNPVVISENTSSYLGYQYHTIGYRKGDKITYGNESNDIILQGYVLSPRGKSIADSAKYPSYTFVNTSEFKTVTIFPVYLYSTSEQKDKDGSLYTLYYVSYYVYGEKIDGTQWEEKGNLLTTRNTNWGGAFQYNTISTPDDSDPYGSVGIYTLAYLTNNDGTYQEFTCPGLGSIPFASIAEYNAAIQLSKEPLVMYDVTQDVMKIGEADEPNDLPTIGDVDTLYITYQPPACWKYSTIKNKYYCVGRDYRELQRIKSSTEESNALEVLNVPVIFDCRTKTEWELEANTVYPKGFMVFEQNPESREITKLKIANGIDKLSDLKYTNVTESELPTKTSQLENDSGFLTEETDPTVPAWAKADTKPTYTASEVGAATVADIKAAVDGIEIGGRNLFLHTKEYDGTRYTGWASLSPATSRAIAPYTYIDGFGVQRISTAWFDLSQEVPIETGTNYTLSAWVKWESEVGVLRFYAGEGTDGSPFISQDVSNQVGVDTFKRVSCTYNSGTSILSTCRFECSTNTPFLIYGLKFEKGNQATDWSPAPEDSPDYIIIGGRNLLLDTSTPTTYTASETVSNKYITYNLPTPYFFSKRAVGKWVTVSFDYEATNASGKMMVNWNGTPWLFCGGSIALALTSANQKGRYVRTRQITQADVDMPATRSLSVVLEGFIGSVTISNIQLEFSNTPSDWTPAPEDAERRITSLEARVAALEAAAVSGGEV